MKEAVPGGVILPGDEIYLLGSVGVSGTREMVRRGEEKLLSIYPPSFVERMRSLSEEDPEEFIKCVTIKGLFPLGEGGLLAGLWEFLSASQVGFCGEDLSLVPIHQETIEACETFGLNPYALYSEGAYLVCMPGGRQAESLAREMGISFTYLGYATSQKKRTLGNHERQVFLTPSAREELLRMPLKEDS